MPSTDVESESSRNTTPSRLWLAGTLISAGIMHFAKPEFYEPLIPEPLGDARAWVHGSGVAELAAGGLLLSRRTERVGAWAAVLVFLGVFPGNIKMAIDAGPPKDAKSVAAWLRLPMQISLVRWALRHTRS